MMKGKWRKEFWNRHGERLVFAALALSLATVMYNIGLKPQAETIFIGIAMLFFNKSRGTNEGDINDTPTK